MIGDALAVLTDPGSQLLVIIDSLVSTERLVAAEVARIVDVQWVSEVAPNGDLEGRGTGLVRRVSLRLRSANPAGGLVIMDFDDGDEGNGAPPGSATIDRSLFDRAWDQQPFPQKNPLPAPGSPQAALARWQRHAYLVYRLGGAEVRVGLRDDRVANVVVDRFHRP